MFSTCKFNTLKIQAENEATGFKNPFQVKKSASIGIFKKVSATPIDFAEVYTQINRILALSYGVNIENEGFSKVKKAKIDPGNNGILVKQTIKKRLWWNASNDDSKLT